MFNSVQSSSKPRRIKIPFLLDIIIVSEPEQIRKIETSGDVERLHSYETSSLPWWVKFYFSATKFHDAERDLWFCPFESKFNPTYQARRNYLQEQVDRGYSEQDVKKIASLLKNNAEDEVLSHHMVQIVNQRFFGKEIPLSITQAAKNTLQGLSEAIKPWQYSRGKKSQKQIMDYCASNLPEEVHILDVGHNIGEVVQATVGALKILKDNLEQPVEEIFTSNAPTPQVPRIATKKSDFNGLLSSPTIPSQTVIILKIAEAAAKTKDISFTFSAGTPERVCVFQEFFLQFMRDLQQELKK